MPSRRASRIGIFGGTFDPVHSGHILVARFALETLGLDRVIFVPCALSPHKSGTRPAPPADRLGLLRAALRGMPGMEVSTADLDRTPPSFSVDTAAHFAALHPKARLVWIMGSDQWKVLHKWKDYRRLASMAEFAVFPRPDAPRPLHGIRFLPLDLRIDISASMIRDRVRRGLSIRCLVPEAVERRITRKGLYSHDS
jgi:nicotinate-nucleotide adenylyltransferase